MNWGEYVFNAFASFISVIIDLLAINKLCDGSKISINIKNFLIVLFSSNLIVINAMYGENLTRSFVILVISFFYVLNILKLDYLKSFSYMIISHIILGIYEVLLSIIVVYFNIVDLSTYDTNALLKAVFSLIVMSLVYITCNIPKVRKISKNISENRKLNKYVLILLSIFSIVLIIVDFKYSQTFSKKVYLSNIIIILSLTVMLCLAIYNHIKVQREVEKTEILLNFMSKYEKLIDEHRVMRHELLNNLLVLKNYKNKKESEDLLNELIDNYSNKGIKINNIYNLPSGLKGMFYYKLYGLEDKNYDINIRVNKKVSSLLKKISHNNYLDLNKIVGIVLDNAIEASDKTKNKLLIIDIYDEENNIVIDISNSFRGKIDINKINDKNYSSKGSNRGFGLYILNNIVKENSNISVDQSINNNIFNTKIVINKK